DAGRVLTQNDPFNLTLTFGYDAANNRTSVTDSLGGQLTSVLDAGNRLTSRQFGGTGQTPLRIDLTWTANDRLATLTRYKNLAGTQLVGTTINTFDDAGNLTQIQHKDGSNANISTWAYSYDAANRLTSESLNGGTATNYGYDNADQLTSAGASSYSFDPNGNRTMSGYQTGTNNRLVSDGTWNYTYDAEGNVTKKVRISDGQTWTYTWNLSNKLLQAEQRVTDGGTLIQRVTFQYDVFGNRVEKQVYTQSTGQAVTQRFAYDGANLWADLDGSNNLVMRRLYLDGPDQVFARIAPSGTAAWYLADHLGSIRDITENNNGTAIDHIDYDAWGKVTNDT